MNAVINSLLTRFHPGNYITFYYKNRTFAFKIHNREERIGLLEKRLFYQRQKYTPLDYVKHVLRSIHGCHYVIFQCNNKDKFIQFGLRDGFLMMDYPLTPANKLLGHLKIVRKLLESYGFSFEEKTLKYMSYLYREEKDMSMLDAHFGNNIDLAAKFVIKVFEDIYKDDISQLSISLG